MSNTTQSVKKAKRSRKGRRPTLRSQMGSTAMARIPSNMPLPARTRKTFFYDTFFTLNNAAVLGASQTYNCSTPQQLSGTVAIPGFSAYFGASGSQFFGASANTLYAAYRVRGASVKVECDNLDTAVSYRIVAGFTQEALPTNGAVSAANQGRFASNPDFRSFTLGVSAGQSRGNVTVSSTIQKLFGVLVFNNNDTFSQYALSISTVQAPTTPMYFVLMCLGSGVMTTGIATRLRFSFDVEAYCRNDLTS